MLTVQASFTQLAHKASLAVLAPRPQLQNGPSNPPISLLSLQVSVIQLVLPASVSILAPQASMTISGHPQSGPSRPQLQNCNCFVSHLGPNGPSSLNCFAVHLRLNCYSAPPSLNTDRPSRPQLPC